MRKVEDGRKTKSQLMQELKDLRMRCAESASSESRRKRVEQALRESQRTLFTLMSNLPGMVYRCRNDKDWTMEYVSKGSLPLTGYRPNDLMNNRKVSFAELIHPDDQLYVWNVVQEALARKEPYHLSYRIITASGKEKWVWEQGMGVFSKSGGLISLEGFIADITERKIADEALKSSERKFRSLFENSADAILLLDGDVFTDCNQAAVSMMRCSGKEQLLSMHPWELSPEKQPDGRLSVEKAKDMIATAFEKGSNRFRWIHRRINGEDFPVEVLLTAVPMGDRQILHTVWRDITHRVRAEEALKESEENYRTLVESSSDAILLMDKKRKLVSCNQAFFDLFGFDREKDEILGKSVRIIHPSDESFFAFGRKAYPVLLKEGAFRTEWELMRRDGTIFPIEGTMSRVRTSDGESKGYMAIIRDITSRKKAEKELERHRDHLGELVRERTAELIASEEKYRTLVENVPLVVYRMKPNGDILLINHFVQEAFGYTPAEIFRDPGLLNEIVIDEDQPKVEDFRKKCLHEGQEFVLQYRVNHKEGRLVYVMDHAIPFKADEGSVSSVDGIIMDISNLVELQKRLVRSKELKTINEVSARLAHEIRNPLVSAGGFARRLLISMSPEDPNRSKVEIIVKEVARLETILRMILAYIQPLELYLTPTNPNRIVEDAIKRVREEVKKRNIQVHLELAPAPPKIPADKVQMERVVETLVKNALNQIREGSVLSLSTFRDNGSFKLVMTYPVMHMSPDDVEHFFYPFTTSLLTKDAAYLPLSKLLIDKHGGVITVNLTESGELSIHISLPI